MFMSAAIKKESLLIIFMISLLVSTSVFTTAQICTSGSTTFYGLSTTGRISSINMSTGAVGAALHNLTTGSAAENANGLGYNSRNGKFYYFYRSAATSAGPANQFVSYDPATSTLATLSLTNFTSTARRVRSGCVNNDGTGYYCFDAGDASNAPHLWYYSISANSWTDITSIFKNGSTIYTPTFKDLNSGDMAFDGSGNLWMLLSRSTNYALYKIPSPPKVNTPAGITVQEVIAPSSTASLATGGSITGFGFNSAGQAYLTTANNNNKIFRMNTASLPTYVASIAVNDMGADLTSCSAPMAILPANFENFSVDVRKDIQLKWSAFEEPGIAGYNVEYSTDGQNWRTLAFVARKNTSGGRSEYIYNHQQFSAGRNYYRVEQIDRSEKTMFSSIKSVVAEPEAQITIGPNPASDFLYLRIKDNSRNSVVEIFDDAGRLMSRAAINSPNTSVNISSFRSGHYILKVTSNENKSTSYQFFKR